MGTMKSPENPSSQLCSTGKLNDTLVFSQALLEPMAYVGMGSGTGLATAPFLREEGSIREQLRAVGISHWVVTMHNLSRTF